jgi:valyl-tRNA synthetase
MVENTKPKTPLGVPQKSESRGKGYDFEGIETKWASFWEEEEIFKFDVNSEKPIFSVDTPPPTVSGRLHMGHAFGDSQQDFFVRFKRMRGFNVLNPFGTDNNGLPTLKLVEKEKKVKSKDMSREEFIELCNKTIHDEFIPMFVRDSKRLGISADRSVFYSTIDERSRRISQKSFIDLYNKGREYRVDSPALWCPKCQTTIAQVELEDKECSSYFNDIIFKVEGEDLIVATTRPELLPACVSLFINSDDKRAKDLVGKKAKVPLFDFEVPILADSKADPEKGSGVVMCCTFGDQTDMEWQKEYQLPIKTVIAKNGTMTSISGNYEGMKIEEARKKIIKDLKEADLLIKQKKITHAVNVCERCTTPIEFVSSKQWFIKYLDLKDDMIKWGNEIKWYPDFMKVRYENWVNGLKWDWCISRQIPFGIPFPVWYCEDCGEVILAKEEDLPVDPLEDSAPVENCPKCGSKKIIGEKDIMNTWATSALTPTIIKDLYKDTPIYEKIKDVPMTIRRNGHDIITFWDFNSVVKSQLHYGFNPWDELFINGWMLGRDGKKMSKSRGNGIAPQTLLEEYGADVLRYLSAYSKLGEDLKFPEQELVAGKKFVNKLVNAAKFVFMNLEDYDYKKPKKLEKIDELFLNKLQVRINEATKFFDKYEYSRVRQIAEEFFWKDFCDNYLEIVKKRIYGEEGKGKKSAQYTLHKSLLDIIKMIAPLMPFVSEEIYQTHFKKDGDAKSIHLSDWPKEGEVNNFEELESFYEVLGRIRGEKSNAKKSMRSEIKVSLDKETHKKLEGMIDDLSNVTNATNISEGEFGVEFV